MSAEKGGNSILGDGEQDAVVYLNMCSSRERSITGPEEASLVPVVKKRNEQRSFELPDSDNVLTLVLQQTIHLAASIRPPCPDTCTAPELFQETVDRTLDKHAYLARPSLKEYRQAT